MVDLNPKQLWLGRTIALSVGLFSAISAVLIHAFPLLSSSQILFIRGIFGTLIFGLIIRKNALALFRIQSMSVWGASIIGSIGLLCFYWSLQLNSIGTAKVLADSSLLTLAFTSHFIYKESVSRRELISIVLLIVSISLLHLETISTPSALGLSIGLIGAVLTAFSLQILRHAAQKFSSSLIAFCFSICLVITSILTKGLSTHIWYFHLPNKFYFVLFGIVSSGLVAFFLLAKAYSYISSSTASGLGKSSLLWMLLFAIFFLDKWPTIIEWTSYLIAFFSIVVLYVQKKGSEE